MGDDDVNAVFNQADYLPSIFSTAALVAFYPVDVAKHIKGIVKPNAVF